MLACNPVTHSAYNYVFQHSLFYNYHQLSFVVLWFSSFLFLHTVRLCQHCTILSCIIFLWACHALNCLQDVHIHGSEKYLLVFHKLIKYLMGFWFELVGNSNVITLTQFAQSINFPHFVAGYECILNSWDFVFTIPLFPSL